MAEKLHTNSPEAYKTPEKQGEKDGSKAEKAIDSREKIQELESKASQEKLDDLLRSAQEKAKKGSETASDLDGQQSTKGVGPQLIGSDLQKSSLRQSLNRIQKKLPFDQRALSKFAHKPIVDSVSTAAEKTVARPSGLVMGGLFSLTFSLFTLWLSYFFGYDYNYMLGIASFIAGFFLGLLIEGMLRIVTHKKRNSL